MGADRLPQVRSPLVRSKPPEGEEAPGEEAGAESRRRQTVMGAQGRGGRAQAPGEEAGPEAPARTGVDPGEERGQYNPQEAGGERAAEKGAGDSGSVRKPMRALITGITGQDGSYLADLLLEKGYQVYGMVRRASTENFERIGHLIPRVELKQADLLDQLSLISVLEETEPQEVYNFAAQSFVPTSWVQPVLTAEFTALGVTRLLEAVRLVNPRMKFYQASSSEMFGKVRETPQNENTPFYPRSPYGVAKVYGHHIAVNYRESYGIPTVSGILFNHESPRRGREFVSRKVAEGVARIYLGLADCLSMGNLDAERDWGYAPDYVRAIWLMMQQEKPQDYVVATGVSHSVRDLLRVAFGRVGLNYEEYVKIDPRLLRVAEVDHLQGDASKARRELQWRPEVSFEEMIAIMVEAELEKIKAQNAGPRNSSDKK